MKKIISFLKSNLIFLFFSLFMVSFFYIHHEYLFKTVKKTNKVPPIEAIALTPNTIFTQELKGNDSLLYAFSLQFAVQKNSQPQGSVHISLLEDKKIIETWLQDISILQDNEYYKFKLKNPITFSSNKVYAIQLYIDLKTDDTIGLCITNIFQGRYFQNSQYIDHRSMCYSIEFKNSSLNKYILWGATFIFIFIYILIFLYPKEECIVSIILLICCIIYSYFCPFGMSPDEPAHFFRAYEISLGYWASPYINTNKNGGNYLPQVFQVYADNENIIYQSIIDNQKKIDYHNLKKIEFTGASHYSPIGYLPQALGIKIAKKFTNNLSIILYSGRYVNCLISVILCIYALFIIPFGKKILATILLFPATLLEIISLSPDSLTISSSILLLAYILNITYCATKIKIKDIFIIFILCLIVSLSKIIYLILVPLIFLIPNKKIGNSKQWIYAKFGIFIIVLICNLIWLKIGSSYLVAYSTYTDKNPHQQTIFILTHLISYYKIIIETFSQNIAYYLSSMVGNPLGYWFKIKISPIIYISFLLIFIHEIYKCKDCNIEPKKLDRWFFLVLFILGCLLICTSLYVQSTAYLNPLITGIQGRYFTPLLPLFAFFFILTNRKHNVELNNINKKSTRYFYIIVLVLNSIAILDIINHYKYM